MAVRHQSTRLAVHHHTRKEKAQELIAAQDGVSNCVADSATYSVGIVTFDLASDDGQSYPHTMRICSAFNGRCTGYLQSDLDVPKEAHQEAAKLMAKIFMTKRELFTRP